MNKDVMEKPAKTDNDLRIDVLQLKKAALILRAVNHKLRQQILKLIHQKGKITVTEIYVKLRLEQSVASQHLAILRKAGFVTATRDGKFIFYEVNYDRLNDAHRFAQDLLK
ncbi:MAG: metalloregulator ArsR/SmtB family transcription factor [Bacteroidota bacterium]|nr:helix-turn-helix transcriptional regulator [Flavisolibacter sp.]MDQ3844288.1 metalloregulator ArsR/SmtB family transcription factor [Bacteroidota bacterium]MBD0286570.1 helix-turn-helix transcriptional regulator [Flavisolibacter sp.]MBD0297706.1 helix-turn-helix transcriptional regulator [Flavisolibacter sp.]MBD0351798.1 helix-turn-helix transcriptional regulator [Flavisolibacter sp.]